MAEHEELVMAASYSWPAEAYLAQSLLDAEGIESFITDEYMVSTNWLYSNAIGGVKVMVAAPDLEKAQEILEQDNSESVMNELGIHDDPQADGRACPQCGTLFPDKAQEKRRRGMLGLLLWFMPVIGSLIFHVPVPISSESNKCINCGYHVPKE